MRSKLKTKILATLLLATACGGREIAGTDGHTSWLTCENDSDCTNYTCIDGLCRPESAASYTSNESTQDSAIDNDTGASTEPDNEDDSTDSNTELGLSYASTVPGALGAACIPSEEYSTDFSGFSVKEISLSPNDQCQSNLCLVNKFQGRVTCPLGQREGRYSECFTAEGVSNVGVDVSPQLVARRPENSVYCSCRCDGPDPTADYCACGEGFECAELVPTSVPGQEASVGSYCVVAGTNPNVGEIQTQSCYEDLPECDDTDAYTPDALGVEPEAPTESQSAVQLISELILWDEGEPGDYPCAPRKLPVTTNDQGVTQAACRVFEALLTSNEGCEGPGRTVVSAQEEGLVREQMAAGKYCTACEEVPVCELAQLVDTTDPDVAASCLNEEDATGDGWCYIAPSQGMGDDALVSNCPDAYPQRLRGVGTGLGGDSLRFLYCLGSL
jgi:hypothetical protein